MVSLRPKSLVVFALVCSVAAAMEVSTCAADGGKECPTLGAQMLQKTQKSDIKVSIAEEDDEEKQPATGVEALPVVAAGQASALVEEGISLLRSNEAVAAKEQVLNSIADDLPAVKRKLTIDHNTYDVTQTFVGGMTIFEYQGVQCASGPGLASLICSQEIKGNIDWTAWNPYPDGAGAKVVSVADKNNHVTEVIEDAAGNKKDLDLDTTTKTMKFYNHTTKSEFTAGTKMKWHLARSVKSLLAQLPAVLFLEHIEKNPREDRQRLMLEGFKTAYKGADVNMMKVKDGNGRCRQLTVHFGLAGGPASGQPGSMMRSPGDLFDVHLKIEGSPFTIPLFPPDPGSMFWNLYGQAIELSISMLQEELLGAMATSHATWSNYANNINAQVASHVNQAFADPNLKQALECYYSCLKVGWDAAWSIKACMNKHVGHGWNKGLLQTEVEAAWHHQQSVYAQQYVAFGNEISDPVRSCN